LKDFYFQEYRVKEIKYPKVFDRFLKGVHARVLSRLEVSREISRGITLLNTLREIRDQNISKEDKD
jgi:hypothetical protein